MNFDKLLSAVKNKASESNIDQWEMLGARTESVGASTFTHEIAKISSTVKEGISMRVIRDGKEGFASSDKCDEDEAELLLLKAYDNALVNDKDGNPKISTPDSEYREKEVVKVNEYSLSDLKKILLEKEAELYKSDDRVKDGTNVSASFIKSESFMANSEGLSLSSEEKGSYVASFVKVEEAGEVAVSRAESLDASGDVSGAVKKAVSQLGAGYVKSGMYPVVFSPDSMIQILDAFFPIFSGKSASLGLSRLKGKEGAMVASNAVTIKDDPFYPGYPFQRSYDGDGKATYTKSVIENGVLKTLLYNNEWAEKEGKESTANCQRSAFSTSSVIAPYSFYFEKGELSREELFKKAEGGVYVTQMKGFHAGANAVSGDFSIESAGYMIKDGKAVEAVKQFTVAGNFYSLLENIAALSDELEFDVSLSSSRIGSPDVLVKELSIAGV